MVRRKSFGTELKGLCTFVVLMWAGFALSFVLPIIAFGIRPRNAFGLIGVVAAPFLHGNWNHLIANTTAVLGLGLLCILSTTPHLFSKLLALTVLSGLGTWLIGGANEIHIGASGLIFGMMGLLLGRGWLRRDFRAVVIALITLFLYGGAIWGVLPIQPGVSWEAHLCGFIAGLLVARA